MPNYSLKQFAEKLGLPCEKENSFSNIAVDTRLMAPNTLFFALPGANVDGHKFLKEAKEKGAVAAVVKKNYTGDNFGLPLLFVDDVLESLQTITREILLERKTKIVGVTGSLGKTTTKDFITALLRPKFRVSSTPGNSNSQIGIPLAILNHTTGEEDILVIEMGMTVPGNISKLLQIAPPDIAIITTVALVHACNFESLHAIAKTKAEILSHPKTRLGILDRGIENYEEIAKIGGCQKISFALDSQEADFSLQMAENSLIIRENGQDIVMDPIPVPGRHNLHNFLGASVVARQFGITWEEIRATLPALNLPERRLQFVQKHGALFVNDSYNASQNSMKAALECLPEPEKGGKKIAFLGEMLELGKFSEECHREVGLYALKYVDHLFCFGKECKTLFDVWKAKGRPVEWSMERADMVAALRKILTPGDVILLKGSRSKEVWKVLDEL